MDLSIEKVKNSLAETRQGIVDKFKETKRVLKITEKPDREEFSMSAKVTGAGMVIIGSRIHLLPRINTTTADLGMI